MTKSSEKISVDDQGLVATVNSEGSPRMEAARRRHGASPHDTKLYAGVELKS